MNEDIEASAPQAPGWFGKIPALGDFAMRRLPAEFTELWDAWLAESIEASEAELGQAWRNVYLRAPIWRFMLAPDIIDDRFWFGVLMPSIDRVGRYFPLTIVTPCAQPPQPPLALLETWFERATAAALDCLSPGATADQLEQTL